MVSNKPSMKSCFSLSMNNSRLRSIFLGMLLLLCMITSCIPPMCGTRHAVVFQNSTGDTLLICASRFDSIDSVLFCLEPKYKLSDKNTDSIEITLWEGETVKEKDIVYPDSLCRTELEALFLDNDTCYFFLVKWHDAKQYSWDEIRSKKLYRRWVTVKNKEGEFDRNIRYD